MRLLGLSSSVLVRSTKCWTPFWKSSISFISCQERWASAYNSLQIIHFYKCSRACLLATLQLTWFSPYQCKFNMYIQYHFTILFLNYSNRLRTLPWLGFFQLVELLRISSFCWICDFFSQLPFMWELMRENWLSSSLDWSKSMEILL